MPQGIWTLTNLTQEQERLLKEAEGTLGDNVLLAYSEGEVVPSQLDESQIECIQGLEKQIGVAVLAVKRT